MAFNIGILGGVYRIHERDSVFLSELECDPSKFFFHLA